MRWLHLLSQLGLGACLADDMGLGKTIQVLVAAARAQAASAPARAPAPSLLVAPGLAAGQLGRGDRALRAGPQGARRPPVGHAGRRAEGARRRSALADADLVITSYGSLLRLPWLAEHRVAPRRSSTRPRRSRTPDAKQTRAVKELQARARIALTGTPVENRLGDLWSIFDFLNPGLLGSAKRVHGATPSASRSGRTTPTARCATWCGRTSCGA